MSSILIPGTRIFKVAVDPKPRRWDSRLTGAVIAYMFSLQMRVSVFFTLPFLMLWSSSFAGNGTTQTTSKQGMVVTCQPLAAEIGVNVLRNGGNAADAFITTTLAEYVTAYGYTSLSGPLNLLYFNARSRSSAYLNAGLNTVAAPDGQWSDSARIPGTSYVIGGAGRGLESLFQRYGGAKFTFANLVAPAAALAKKGFPISQRYADAIRKRMPVVGGSPDWKALFTKNGMPLRVGDILVQPEFADTLTGYGREGADFLFKGKFAVDLVRTIQANGGKLTLRDLASYQVYWNEPLEASYRSFKVKTGSYRSYGGLQLLLALKTLENLHDLPSRHHYSTNENLFETILRTYLFGLNDVFPLITGHSSKLDSIPEMEGVLNGARPAELWRKVMDRTIPAPFAANDGQHSCNTIVIDREGNIATGTHTISSLKWGDFGLFADGVSLNSAYPVTMKAPPGTRAVDGLSPVIVFEKGKPVAAAGFFASGLQPAAYQVMVNLLDYSMTPKAALEAPRFGYVTGYDPLKMLLDARYPKSWVKDFSKKGISFSQPSGFIDTGMGMVIRIDHATGTRCGSPTELVPEAVAVSE
ncbi:MAG: hypothetical protein A2583_12705 [Bdellovibrionales bacterium RIFOXYD1_FULL_53_11]|nr:MAG: hypothetical protein A2583_12705 [Bdellovibrionales bacterium RIFOXYD1_FULL_53_11]